MRSRFQAWVAGWSTSNTRRPWPACGLRRPNVSSPAPSATTCRTPRATAAAILSRRTASGRRRRVASGENARPRRRARPPLPASGPGSRRRTGPGRRARLPEPGAARSRAGALRGAAETIFDHVAAPAGAANARLSLFAPPCRPAQLLASQVCHSFAEPWNTLRSTLPTIPGTAPSDWYCQKCHLRDP